MYELDDYLLMVSDRLRTPAYLAAMREVIRPGDHVLDLGTGFGFFAIEACRLGAAHVWAVEPNDAIGLGRAIAEANGCTDRVTFLQRWSTELTLPRRADVLVEDLRGISPLLGHRLTALRDARQRLLVEQARRLPFADELLLAPAELPDDLARLDVDADDATDGIAIGPVRQRLRETIHRTDGGVETLLAPGRTWVRLDLGALDGTDPSGSVEWRAERAGRLHGLLSWFRALLTPTIAFETGPSVAKSVYSRGFLPISNPVAIHAGDRIHSRIRTRFDGADYVWVWTVSVEREGVVVAERRGSNLASHLLSSERRAQRAADHRPVRSEAVELLASLLQAVNGERCLDEIAAILRARHPAHFAAPQDALRWAGDRLGRISEEPAR